MDSATVSHPPFAPFVLAWPLGLEIHLAAIAQCVAQQADDAALQEAYVPVRDAWAALVAQQDPTEADLFDGLERLRDLAGRLQALETAAPGRIYPVAAPLQGWCDWLDRFRPGTQSPLILTGPEPASFPPSLPRDGIRRLFGARDRAVRLSDTDSDLSRRLPDPAYRVATFLDHALEEVEALCLGVGRLSFAQLQYRVDTAQRFIQQGLSLEEGLDEEGRRSIGPLLENIRAFLEAFDQVLHAFQEQPERACAVALALRALHDYLIRQPDGGRWDQELRVVRELLDKPEPTAGLWASWGDGRRRRDTLRALRRGRRGGIRGEAGSVNAFAWYRKLHPWLCLGPRLLAGLALTSAQQAVEDRHVGRASRLLRAFAPPAARRARFVECGRAASHWCLRGLACWGAWLAPLLIYGPWLLAGAGAEPLAAAAPVAVISLALLAALVPLLPLLVLVSRLPEWTPIASECPTHRSTLAHWWWSVSGAVHRGLLLPPFLFKAGFGVAVAVTAEFDYQFWLMGLESAWLPVAGLLLLLCAMGCYAQVRIRSLRGRLLATLQALGVYAALAHLPAVLAAWVLHDALRGLLDEGDLPATIPLLGFGEISLYCVLFMALTGMVIGIVGDTFLERARDKDPKD